MKAERQSIPDWAEQERAGDLNWIKENLPALETASQVAYQGSGRGVLFIDVAAQPLSEPVQMFGYLPQSDVEESADEDTIRMVRAYNPNQEFVIILFKETERSSTYRICPQRRPSPRVNGR